MVWKENEIKKVPQRKEYAVYIVDTKSYYDRDSKAEMLAALPNPYHNNQLKPDNTTKKISNKLEVGGEHMEIFKILPNNYPILYLFLAILISLIIRVVLCLFKVAAIRQGEAGKNFKNKKRGEIYFKSFFSLGHSKYSLHFFTAWCALLFGLNP
ncbi:MAG: hypothetical protein ISS45_07005 [Candidatus Omnitrophica bacterium]|nr:hypothetical protein [Candidatus Omnitrophota bacterium]